MSPVSTGDIGGRDDPSPPISPPMLNATTTRKTRIGILPLISPMTDTYPPRPEIGTRARRHRFGRAARIPRVENTERRDFVLGLLNAGLAAVDPRSLTASALIGRRGPLTLVAIGKAAPAMCRGASDAVGDVTGVCVAGEVRPVPDGVALVIGDHPVPGRRSFRAGRRVLKVVSTSRDPIVALISGGGSALCEHPIEGVPPGFIADATRSLLGSGAAIDDLNLVRRHLSAIKGGGLARAAGVPVETLAISDVCGADPSVIASGPSVPVALDPEAALEVMARHGIEVPDGVRRAISERRASPPSAGAVTVLGDGRTAAVAAAAAATASGLRATVRPGWLQGDVATALDDFLSAAKPGGITLAAGEPEVRVTGAGIGGRNTHAALMAARRIAGTEAMFAAFATDGVDGNSGAAGAIVDGSTVARGGVPDRALAGSDSATYLKATGDLIVTGPTGTNVSDIWLLWH